jgi:hypothetical protein
VERGALSTAADSAARHDNQWMGSGVWTPHSTGRRLHGLPATAASRGVSGTVLGGRDLSRRKGTYSRITPILINHCCRLDRHRACEATVFQCFFIAERGAGGSENRIARRRNGSPRSDGQLSRLPDGTATTLARTGWPKPLRKHVLPWQTC